MVVPGALGAQDGKLEVGIHSRHRDVKPVHLLAGAVAVGHGIGGGLQPVGLVVGSVGCHAQIQVDDLFRLQADVHRHLPVRHRQRALAVAGFIRVEHAAVGVKIGCVDTVRQGGFGCGGLALAFRCGGSLNGGSRLACAFAGRGGRFRRAAACQQQGCKCDGYDLKFLHGHFPTLYKYKIKKLPEGSPSGRMLQKSAVQGVHGGLSVVNVDLLDGSDLAQTCDLGIDAVKAAGSLELA